MTLLLDRHHPCVLDRTTRAPGSCKHGLSVPGGSAAELARDRRGPRIQVSTLSTRPVFLLWGDFVLQGLWQCLETVLVAAAGLGALPASSGQMKKPGMLPNIVPRTGQPPTVKNYLPSKVSNTTAEKSGSKTELLVTWRGLGIALKAKVPRWSPVMPEMPPCPVEKHCPEQFPPTLCGDENHGGNGEAVVSPSLLLEIPTRVFFLFL